MGDKYTAHGDQTVANPMETTITLTGNVLTRGRCYEIGINALAVPADVTLAHKVQRCTAIGTATAVTEQALDDGAPAAQLIASDNHTVEPTYTAGEILLKPSVNQRATYRWVAVPGGEFLIPAVANEGIGIGSADVNNAATPEVEADIYWEE